MAVPANLLEGSGAARADVFVGRLWQKTADTFEVPLKARSGAPLETPAGCTATLSVMEVPTSAPIVTLTGTVSSGAASFPVTATSFMYPAVYAATVIVKDSGGSPLSRMRLFIDVQHDGVTQLDVAPVCIDDVRQAVVDRCADDNQLMSEVEFTDGEIAAAMHKALDWWNDIAPEGCPFTFSVATYPWPQHWIEGTLGYLYQAKTMQLQRNRLPISGGGINTDDKAKADAYARFSQLCMQNWRAWANNKMVALNLDSWWGSVQDPNYSGLSTFPM